MAIKNRITPFLWFDDQAEEAAGFYTKIQRHSSAAGSRTSTDSHGRSFRQSSPSC